MKNFVTLISSVSLCAALLSSRSSEALTVSANVKGNLPSVLVESSGLDYTGGSHFWSLNDSGDPKLFRIADDGSLTRTIDITGVHNYNWEDLTHDAGRNYMFIGEFGNNNCDRTNLKIYRIPYPSTIAGNSVAADQISFSYQDQTRFPSPWMNFDVEAFFHFHGQLFLFTKTDGSAVGYTKMYVLPDVPGNYVAQLVDSFYTNDRTTGAAISPDGKSIVLLANTRLHIFRNFNGNDFFHGTHTLVSISGGWTQKEGVDFSSDNEIYMTDENSGNGNHIYYIDLSAWIPASPINTVSVSEIQKSNGASAFPNPANEQVNISFKGDFKNASVALFDLTGKVAFQSQVNNTTAPFEINTAILPAGIYFYRVYEDAKEVQTARLVVNH